ncbi:glutathione S-transferase omega-1-like [Pogonomyrmex barbatus]|uniref:Glutathione S-transferase omega-1-like n=1 Tax=Pogonomyrmex barbatus TaxID=144034 RepID=A0A6I9W3K6_9HYME|nr:glutathione S-transferase omega-1-like [Pogonomyrmex barbatus]
MSSLHLANGSEKPAEVEGQARLYSMEYCPFAHRIRLVLSLKNIPHDIVNINLQSKPDWFLEIHPDGKVPAFIDLDGTLVTDSVAVANYLDEKYPEPSLYNDETKDRDLELLDHFSKIMDTFANCIFNKDKRQFEKILAEVTDDLQEFEDELNARNTTFFGGSNPGMLDILIWPWFERAKALTLLYKQRASLDKERFPRIMEWVDGMKDQPFIVKHRCPYDKFAKFIEAVRTGNVDYDNL